MATGHLNVNIKSKDKGSNSDSSISTSYYDVVIKSQAEFDNFVNTYGIDYDGPYVNVLILKPESPYSTYEDYASDPIILSPKVKKIHAPEKITLFLRNSTAIAFGYQDPLIEGGYEIQNIMLEFFSNTADCGAFVNCNNLTNCEVKNSSDDIANTIGYKNCKNLNNCIYNSTETRPYGSIGFSNCSYLTDCSSRLRSGRVYKNCSYLFNCSGSCTADDTEEGGITTYEDCSYCFGCSSVGLYNPTTATHWEWTDPTKELCIIDCPQYNNKIRPTFYKLTGDVMTDTGSNIYLISPTNLTPNNITPIVGDTVIFYTDTSFYIATVNAVNAGSGISVQVNKRLGYLLPEITSADEGKTLKVENGKFVLYKETDKYEPEIG